MHSLYMQQHDKFYEHDHVPSSYIVATMLVGSCLANKVFIGNLPAMGRGWVIIK